jgi:hypothetical protein
MDRVRHSDIRAQVLLLPSRQGFENALQIFFRNLLAVGDLLERNVAVRLVLCQVDHNTQGVAPLGGYFHRTASNDLLWILIKLLYHGFGRISMQFSGHRSGKIV